MQMKLTDIARIGRVHLQQVAEGNSMKINVLRIVAVASAFLATSVLADQARVTAYQAQLRDVRVTQLAGETARLVAAEKSDARAAAAADAITAAISLHSPSTPFVVGSVSKSSPETAASAAATAVKLQPKMAGAISKAAVSAAPSEIESIVGAMCKAQPAAFYAIGISAAAAAPKMTDKIMPAMTASVPMLKPLFARSKADFAAAKRAASLALVLKHADDLLMAMSRDASQSPETMLAKETETTMATRVASSAVGPAPVLLPPFVTGGPPPTEQSLGTEVAPGGRTYSAP